MRRHPHTDFQKHFGRTENPILVYISYTAVTITMNPTLRGSRTGYLYLPLGIAQK